MQRLRNILFQRRVFGIIAAASLSLKPVHGEPAVKSSTAEVLPQVSIVVARDQKTTRTRLEGNVREILSTFRELGAPMLPETTKALDDASKMSDYDAIGSIQIALDKYALLTVGLNDEAWFSVVPASATPKDRILTRGRWRTFLIKIDNSSRVTSPLGVRSGQAIETLSPENAASKDTCQDQPHDWSKWFLMRMIGAPLMPDLMTGKEVEYFVMQLCSLDAGDRAAEFTFYLGGGQVSQGHYGSTMMLFKAIDQAAAR